MAERTVSSAGLFFEVKDVDGITGIAVLSDDVPALSCSLKLDVEGETPAATKRGHSDTCKVEVDSRLVVWVLEVEEMSVEDSFGLISVFVPSLPVFTFA